MAFNRFSNGIGNLFGPTMGNGLQSLVTQRLDNLLEQSQPQRQTMQGLEALGFNPQEAGAMSGMGAMVPQQQEIQQPLPQQIAAPARGRGKKSQVAQQEIQIPEKPQSAAAQKEEAAAGKTFREWYGHYQGKAREAGHNKDIYKQVAKLAESGKLWSGASKRVLNQLPGGDIVSNDSTDLFKKLQSNLAATATSLFPKGTNITNYIEQVASGVLPNLEMSNDTIAAVADLNSLVQEMAEVEEREARKLAKKWKGNLPWSADIDLFEAAQPELKKIEDKIYKVGSKLIEGNYRKNREPQSGETLGENVSEYADRIQHGQSATDTVTGQKVRFDSNKKQWVPAGEFR